MRRWLALLLIALLPVQFVWAAAAPYCQHETSSKANHIGHHEHQHKDADASGHKHQQDVEKTKKIFGDEDCGYCHFSATISMRAVSIAVLAISADSHSAAATLLLPMRDPEPVDRPKWLLA